ncbi:MAG: hypothetical protein HFJ09_07160 [Lachnospiraceae bacterium]|nr:hypothetical protein [Lachnospiraceae bacterium]
MDYGLVINIGYAGTVIFAILTIYLCFKLNLKNCILEVSGLERKKRVKEWREGGIVKDKKKKKESSKKNAKRKENITKDTEVLKESKFFEDMQQEKLEHTILLTEEEETNILRENIGNIETEKQEDLDFVYLKDIVVVHTKDRIEQ